MKKACPTCGVILSTKNELRQNRCRPCHSLRRVRWLERNPWAEPLYSARARCRDKSNSSYEKYGGRGIRSFLTVAEVKRIWERDLAEKMITPSLDRIDSDGNYTAINCRFIEQRENSRLGAIKRARLRAERAGAK